MRRIAGATLAALVLLVLPAAAGAAVTPTRSASAVVDAITDGPTAGAAITEITPPNTTTPTQGEPIGIGGSALSSFPIEPPTFAILSSGDARSADPENGLVDGDNGGDSADPNRANAHDITTVRVDLSVPAEARCITFGLRFFTDEEINAFYNDGFIAELDSNNWSIDPATNAIIAPSNFAFDSTGQVISVHSEGQTALSPEDAAGTNYANGTAELGAARFVAPGRHSIYFTIFDQGDAVVDSAVFLDRLALLNVPADDCTPGARTDSTPPRVAITSPANGSASANPAPVLSGSAGDASGDLGTVTVDVRPAGGGTSVQTLTATRSGPSWSTQAAPLSPGTYSAVATQSDTAGNVGTSGALTFTVTTPPPPPPPPPPPSVTTAQSPVPVLGKTVVAGKVGAGTVRIKGKNGKFRTLGANESIPLGSTIDATKGRVRLTSAAGPGGKVQTADFYKGAFVVTQTKGAKPITQLALAGALRCASRGKASTAAKKKRVRRLWGDGHGSFRTKGRRAAATVRGTRWLTEDRCDSTKIAVKRGTVVVRDFVKRKNVIVKKGHSYVARKKRK